MIPVAPEVVLPVGITWVKHFPLRVAFRAIPQWGSADLSRSAGLQFAAQVVRLGPIGGWSGRRPDSARRQQTPSVDLFLLSFNLSRQSKRIELLM